MPWNGSGTFNRIYSWVADKTAGLDISSVRMDTDTDDITAGGFGNTLTRDGQGFATANLPMGGFRHTSVGNGVARTDYAALGQAQDGSVSWAVAGGTSDAITATYTPALVTLADGVVRWFRASAANLTTTPSFAPDGLTPQVITKWGGQALAVGDIQGAGAEVGVRYNSAGTHWEMLNPPAAETGTIKDWAPNTAPAGWLLAQGQAVSRTGFPALFNVIGTIYGVGDGSTTFNVPDLRGRVTAGLDEGGSNRITVAGGNFDGTTIGNAGGGQNKNIAQTHFPSAATFTNSGITVADSGHTHALEASAGSFFALGGGGANKGTTTGNISSSDLSGLTSASGTANVSITNQGHAASGGSDTPFPIVQPTMMVNKIIKT